MKIFGFSFGKQQIDPNESPAIIAPSLDDSAMNYDGHIGFISPYSSVFDFDSAIKEEKELIERYRDLCKNVQEVSSAVEEICSEAIIVDDKNAPVVGINLDKVTGLPDNIKEMIEESFNHILNLLNFHNKGFEIFKNWYVDGRIFYYVMIQQEAPENGILELRYIDPKKIKKVREVIRNTNNEMGVSSIVDIKEYYVYNEGSGLERGRGVTTGYTYGGNNQQNVPIPMTTESIATSNSGLLDQDRNMVMSYLHSAIRPANNLRMMEDAMLIYRLTRAPERRVFYIDTGDIPVSKREQYVQGIADKYRNKIVYDATTGAIKNDKRYLAMTEDYWIPRPSSASGTEIDTLEGGQAVGETGDTEYFLNRLYTAIQVPKSRFTETPSMFGNGTEITRDEIRFSRFVSRLRNRFSILFEDLVGKDVVLRQIMSREEWDEMKVNVTFDYQEDNLFAEALKANTLNQKLSILAMVEPYVGKYFSPEYVFHNILEMTDDEIRQVLGEIQTMDPRYMPFEMQMKQIQLQQAAEGGTGAKNESVMESMIDPTHLAAFEKVLKMMKKVGIGD